MREPGSISSHDGVNDLATWHPLSRRFAFLAKPATRYNFVWFLLAGLVITSLLGLTVEAKKYAPWDFFASWSVWGLFSYCTVVLMSWPMFKLTARPPGYYNEDGWTGGFEYDWKLAPTVPPEDHNGDFHVRGPLTEDEDVITFPEITLDVKT